MYRLALLISIIGLAVCVRGQTADDYFHGGAQNYIWDEKEKATNAIYTGLRLFPDDAKLNALAVLLQKEQKQQQQQQQQQNQQKDSKKDQEKQQQNQADQNQQQQQQKQQDENQQQQQKPEQQQPPNQQQPQQGSPQPKDKQEENAEQAAAQAHAAGQMTPQEAQQLLDAQKGEEMMLPAKPQNKPVDPSRPVKDW